MNATHPGRAPKRSKVHQYTSGVRQKLIGGGGFTKYAEPVQIDRSSVTLTALAVRFAEIEAQFTPKIDRI